MSRTAWGIVLLFLSRCLWAAPHAASVEDKARILDLIAEGKEAFEDMKEAKDEAASLAAGDPERAYKELQRADRSEAVMTARFNAAIRLAEKAYGVGPTVREGVVQGGPRQDHKTSWAPEFLPPPLGDAKNKSRKAEFIDSRSRATSEIYETFLYGDYRRDTGARAVTFCDGKVVVTLGILFKALDENNPGYVALSLHHEAVHFDELVTTGWKSAPSREAKAYAADFFAAKVLGLPSEERWRAGLLSLRLRVEDVRKHVPAYPDAGGFSSYDAHRAMELYEAEQDLLREARYEREALKARVERAREERRREQEEERRRKEEAERVPEPASDIGSLIPMTAAACKGEAALARDYGYGQYRQMGPEHAMGVEKDAAQVESYGSPDAPCVVRLLRLLARELRAGRVLPFEEIMSAASPPAPPDFDPDPQPRGGKPPCTQRGIWNKDCY